MFFINRVNGRSSILKIIFYKVLLMFYGAKMFRPLKILLEGAETDSIVSFTEVNETRCAAAVAASPFTRAA